MNASSRILVCAAALAAAACAPRAPEPAREAFAELAWADESPETRVALLNRVTWGANAPTLRALAASSSGAYLARQLRPASSAPRLAPEVQAHIDAMTISQRSAA